MGKVEIDFEMKPKIQYFFKPKGYCTECAFYVDDLGWCTLYGRKVELPKDKECKVDTIVVKEL